MKQQEFAAGSLAKILLKSGMLQFAFYGSCLILILFPFYFLAIIRARVRSHQQEKDNALRS